MVIRNYLQKILKLPFFYIWLTLLVMSLPYSRTMISIFEGFMFASWLFSGNFREKYQILKTRKSILFLISIFGVHLLGLLFTSNFKYALDDIRVKIPLLLLPLLIGTFKPLSTKQLQVLFYFFALAIVVNTFIGIAVLNGFTPKKIHDTRELSLWCSHVRFALLICITFFCFVFYLFSRWKNNSISLKITYSILCLWLFVFLFILKSFTGIIILLSGIVLIYFFFFREKVTSKFIKYGIASFLFGLVWFVVFYLGFLILKFNKIEKPNYSYLERTSANGNDYIHFTSETQVENGHYVFLYLCEKELEREWIKRSKLPYNYEDKQKRQLRFILMRYLTSKGLRKDSIGVSKLTDKDIELIENGYANYIYADKNSINAQIYNIIWQFYSYIQTGEPSGHSVTQRIEFVKAGWNIFLDNFWFGVGTGDVNDSYISYYQKNKIKLERRFWLRAHNQYLTFFLTFGILGGIWIFYALLKAAFLEKKIGKYFFIVTAFILFVSMFDEDTLETQVGVTTFAAFYSIALFSRNFEDEVEEHQHY